MKKTLFFFAFWTILFSFSSLKGFSEEIPSSIVLEDFSDPDERGLPKGWIVQRENPAPAEAYRIRKEEGRFYLSATGRPNRIFKKIKWNPNRYPFFSWKWRAKNVPVDPEKERRAAVYVSLDRDLFGIPKITKYLWSSLAKQGEEILGGFTVASVIVVRSGPADAGGWITETINVLEDFKRLHGEAPSDEAYGIGVMTSLEIDFADFVARQAPDPALSQRKERGASDLPGAADR